MKRLWITVAVVVVAVVLILFAPVPRGTFDDGGTREYTALMYKIIDWHRICADGVYDPYKVYFFPKNLLSIDELWKLEHPDSCSPPVTDTADFTTQYIRTDGYHEDAVYPRVRLIRSASELTSYYKENKGLYDLERREHPAADSTIGFLDACDRYDDAFFKEHCLILVLLEEGSGSVRHRVTALRRNDAGKLTVDITTLTPEVGTDDMAQWHLFVETDIPLERETDISLSFTNRVLH